MNVLSWGMPMMGMMGMGMGMPMMPPTMQPIPGVVPGMPGMGMFNSLPGRFGRDLIGREFAGPGGVGSSQPYRPPDPSALPPMPFGLPFVARPGQEGFDQYGRMIPPEPPEGWDGWGRPIMSAAPPPMPQPPAAAATAQAPPEGMAGPAVGTRGTPMTNFQPTYGGPPYSASGISGSGSRSGTRSRTRTGTGAFVPMTGTTDDTGRPTQPDSFDRPPAQPDSFFRYEPFEMLAIPAASLNRYRELFIPREFVSHDVNEGDWTRFIEDLAHEGLSSLSRDFTGRNHLSSLGNGPYPHLTESIHSLLASWAVAFFHPRGIKVYAAKDGQVLIPSPLEAPLGSRGYTRADEWTDSEDESDLDAEDEQGMEQEREARRRELHLPRRERELRGLERQIRGLERQIDRKRERRKRNKANERWDQANQGEWEVVFESTTPTIWMRGARPRTYGEPKARPKA